jgi:phage gp37-like protein
VIATLEAAIVDRLVAECGDLVDRVYTAAEASQVDEQLQLSPSLTVIYNGYTTAGDIAGGVVQGVAFEFLVIIAIRNAQATNRSAGAREDASPILDAVIEALLNWRPVDGVSILRLQDAPGATFSDAGFAYYPLAFKITRTYRAGGV